MLRAWPPVGSFLILASFFITFYWLLNEFADSPNQHLSWLEPLAAILAGTGAFLVAAMLIFRRVEGACDETKAYGLARGLATGYYFNFVRPLFGVLREPKHKLHQDIAAHGPYRIAGLVVGIPESIDDLPVERQTKFLNSVGGDAGKPFKLVEIQVGIPGRPRPVFAKLALSDATKTAIIVDIPTTLSVIADFAEFFAKRELEGSATDDTVLEARKELVAMTESDRFSTVLMEFHEVVNKVGSMEPASQFPTALLHIVPLSRLKRRLDELADH